MCTITVVEDIFKQLFKGADELGIHQHSPLLPHQIMPEYVHRGPPTPGAYQDKDVGEGEAVMIEGTQAVKVSLLVKKELLWVDLVGAGIEGNVTPIVLIIVGRRLAISHEGDCL